MVSERDKRRVSVLLSGVFLFLLVRYFLLPAVDDCRTLEGIRAEARNALYDLEEAASPETADAAAEAHSALQKATANFSPLRSKTEIDDLVTGLAADCGLTIETVRLGDETLLTELGTLAGRTLPTPEKPYDVPENTNLWWYRQQLGPLYGTENYLRAMELTLCCRGGEESFRQLLDTLADERPYLFVRGFSVAERAADGTTAQYTLQLTMLLCDKDGPNA